MLELLTDIPFVSLFLKFIVASTVLLGTVWLLEKFRILNTPDLAELAWKLAIAGSFIAVLPISGLTSSTWTIESSRTAALIENLNESRPLGDVRTQAQDSTAEKSSFDAISRFEQLEQKKQDALAAKKFDTNTNKQQEVAKTPSNGPSEIIRDVAEPSNENNTAANTNNAQLEISEYDSEGTYNNDIWYMAADLRAKDLAALGWGAMALLALAALMFSYHGAVRNLGSRVRVQSEDRANQLLRAVCEKADIRHVPYLSRSSEIKSPVCLPRKEICLPDWAFDDMPEAEFKSLLAHELGHMVRKDPIMLMILQLLSRVFFFQPLFIIARRRLTDIAELAADEWAAKQAENSRAVANALFTCATKIHETRQVQWGLAMAGNKSILKQRVERLVNAQSVPFKTAGTFTKTIVGAGVIGLSLGLPSIEFAGAMNAESGMEMAEFSAEHPHDEPKVAPLPELAKVAPLPKTAPRAELSLVTPLPGVAPLPPMPSVSSTSVAVASAAASANASAHPQGAFYEFDRGRSSGNMNWHQDDRSISMKWRGDFRINDTEDFFIAKDDDGYLKLSTDFDGDDRSIKIDVDDGELKYTYKVEGDERELDSDGKKWLKTAISALLESGYDAENRVARLYKKGKSKAVFAVIDDFESDYVRRMYLIHLMDQAKLSDKEIGKVVDITAKFDSDFEKRLTLSSLLSEEDVSDKVLPDVLKVAKSMDSDFEKRLLVTHYISELKLTDKTTNAVIDIAESIDSDFELRLLMSAALSDAKLSDKNVVRVLDMAIKQMDSDFEKRLLLVQLADEFDRSDLVVSKVLDAADTIDSDFERRLLLASLLAHAELNEKNWIKAIETTAAIDSDFEKTRVFTQMKGELPDNARVQEAFKKASADVMDKMADGEDWHFDTEETITNSINEAMAELSQELAELEAERAEMIAELQEQFSDGDHDLAPEIADRIIREKERAMREVLRDRSRLERDIERATAQALRQVERELSKVQREIGRASGTMKRELAQALRGLEQSKASLQRDLERKREREKQRRERIERDKANEKSRTKEVETQTDTQI